MKILNPDYYAVTPRVDEPGYCPDCDAQLEWSNTHVEWMCPECNKEEDNDE